MKLKEIAQEARSKINGKMIAASAAGATVVAGSIVPAFAAAGDSLPTVSITTEMLTPLVEGVVANIGVILPIGLGLFAIMLGIRIIPGLISRFLHM